MTRTFQFTALFDELRVVDNMALGYQKRTTGKAKTETKILETLGFIGLEEKALEPVLTLSQGEQRRLSIGIALVSDPELILFDEQKGGLIQEDTDEITHLIRKVNQAGVTVCLIEHKMRMIIGLASRIVMLNYGRRVAEGSPVEVAANPEVIEAYLGRKLDA